MTDYQIPSYGLPPRPPLEEREDDTLLLPDGTLLSAKAKRDLKFYEAVKCVCFGATIGERIYHRGFQLPVTKEREDEHTVIYNVDTNFLLRDGFSLAIMLGCIVFFRHVKKSIMQADAIMQRKNLDPQAAETVENLTPDQSANMAVLASQLPEKSEEFQR